MKAMAALITVVFLTMGTPIRSDTLGPPDGTQYVVTSSETVFKSCPEQCGYNDLALPNVAKFMREHRQYTEYAKGKVVGIWTEDVDTFVECAGV